MGHLNVCERETAATAQDEPGIRDKTRFAAPCATLLSCADSQAPPQLIFGQGLGGFANRVAGSIADATIIAYSVERLGVPLAVVLGHSGCGG